MTSQSSIGLLGACLLGSTLLAGCKEPQTQAQAPARPAPPLARTQLMPPAGAMSVAVTPSRPPEALPAGAMSVAVTPSRPPEALPPLNSGADAQSSDVVLAQATETTVAKAPLHRGEDPPQRRSFADITAHPSFAHAPDYSWLSGEVVYSRIGKGWRLRYASVDEEDPYGGSVTLSEDPLLHGLKDGQYIRVQGRLSNPTAKCTAPAYQIDSLQPITSPDADAPARAE